VTAVAVLLALAAAVAAAWSYGLYPVLLRRLVAGAGARPEAKTASAPPSVEVLVAAADEETVIAARVRDLLAQAVAAPYGVAIGCDGSSDGTEVEARLALGERGRVLAFPQRRGKASVLNDLVASSRADVLVFTDANTRFEEGAVAALLGELADPSVGAVCGRLVIERAEGGGTPEEAFWERETALKEAEGRLGICLGANGAIYAARREAVEPLPPDTAMDDFLIPARIARRGLRVVFAADAVARERGAGDILAEEDRRFRIGVGAGQVLRREAWLYAFWRRPLLFLVFLSRKLARWLAPVLGLAAAAAGVFSPALRPASVALLAAALASLAAARARPALTGAGGKLYYFVVLNLALAAGVVCGLAGYSRPAWKPTAR
jgi:cellulose synthase/poly-beta-1,6-N-acetylglucosamine synthase-like glycosyltransferase